MAWSDSLRGALCILALTVGTIPAIGQVNNNQLPPIFGIFSGLINNAITQETRQKWDSVPLTDYRCLSSRGLSVDALIAHGIGPKDPRIRQVLSQCVRPTSDFLPGSASEAAPAGFVVDGVALGALVNLDGDNRFACHDSDDFVGFRWCQRGRSEAGKFGPHTVWSSILRSDKNQAVYIMEAIVPAIFSQNDPDAEIQRLSQMFGQPANIVTPPFNLGAHHAVLATWGKLVLSELDQPTMQALRDGDTIHRGVLVDFIGDPRKSARMGLPVYSIGGGPGYIWNADYDNTGRGALRLTTCDASKFPSNSSGSVASLSDNAPVNSPSPLAADEIAQKAAARAAAAKLLAENAAKTQAEVTQLEVSEAFAKFRNSKANPDNPVISLLNYSSFGNDGGADTSFWAKKDETATGTYVLYELGTTLQAPLKISKEFDVTKIDPAHFFVKQSGAGVSITSNDAVIFVCDRCDKASVENRWVKYFSQDAGK